MTIARAQSLALCLVALLAACGPNAVQFPTPTTTATEISYEDYEYLLGRYVTASGDVDYEAWHQNKNDVAMLDQYLGVLTASPPKLRPDLFASKRDEISYWINLYNALVVREVVRRWPLESVRDYRPTLTSKIDTTKGFFRDLRFEIGNREMSLDDIEHATIRSQFDDARIHFALNCGSTSCPVLRPKAYSGAKLEAELQDATRAFLSEPSNVSVDVARRRIRLSKIFKWYGRDFRKHARRETGTSEASVLDFVALFAKPDLERALKKARRANYQIEYADYDWAVNDGVVSPNLTSATSRDYAPESPLPRLDLMLLDGTRYEREEGKALVISFWATYCSPCRESLPHLQTIAERDKDRLRVLAVSADETRAQIDDFLESQSLDLDIAYGPGVASLMAGLGVQSLPTELFVDSQGRMRFSLRGAATTKQLDDAVARLLEE